MDTIALDPQLMQQVNVVAALSESRPDELVASAVRSYLRQLEREKIKREARAFEALHPQLLKDYFGQYVAIHNGQLVDSDQNFQSLHRRIRQQYGRQAVLLRRVEADPEATLTIRSPRFEAE